MLAMTTSDIIQRLLKTGMSQAEIARRVGMHQPTICRWANGGAPDGADRALALKDLLAQREIESQAATQ